MDNIRIRKLIESDYDQVIELYTQLDEFHIEARPDCFVHREEALHFQEQYFISTIDSVFRKSCGVIPFRWNGCEKEYLILLQTNNCWSFPKGHMEAGETEEKTAMRELHEETGLHARLIVDQKTVFEYDIPPYTRKQVVLFLGEVEGEPVLQETEVINHRWVKSSELKVFLQPDTYDSVRRIIEVNI